VTHFSDYKKIGVVKSSEKIHCNANKYTAAAQLIVEEKTGDSSNACVCLYMSLKLLRDDHSDLVAV